MFPFREATATVSVFLIQRFNYYKNVPPLPLFTSTLKRHENALFFFSFIELLHSRIPPRRFYRIVPFNEGLEKLIFPSVASLVAIQLIKLHGIFNLAL